MNEDPQLLSLRVPPHSIEAEQSLIGALLLDNEAFERVADLVNGDDFYKDNHRRIWRHIARLIEANKTADVVSVFASIDGSDDKDKTGGPAYLGQLAQNTPSALNVRQYAELVRSRSALRRLAQAATEIAEEALSPGAASRDVGQLMDEAESKIFQIAEASARRSEGPQDIKPLLSRVFERIDHLYHRDNASDVTGVPTGFIDLDRRTSGLQPGDLIVVAGRPSMGKTALALNIVEHAALQHGLPAAVFSMEMSGTQLATRLLGSIAQVDQHKMRTGKLNDDEWARLSDAMSKLHEAPISIDETGALTALEVRARARRLKRQHAKLGLVVIDYLQLMSAKSQGENRATEIAEMSRTLKAMAKELECPVVVLSQLNRAVDSRPDRRPVMSDLRESGAIEQDADVILFLYREAVYNHDLPDEQKACAEVIIGKQRNGPIGTVKLLFRGQHTRFDNFQDPGFGDGSFRWPNKVNSKRSRGHNFYDVKAAAAGDLPA